MRDIIIDWNKRCPGFLGDEEGNRCAIGLIAWEAGVAHDRLNKRIGLSLLSKENVQRIDSFLGLKFQDSDSYAGVMFHYDNCCRNIDDHDAETARCHACKLKHHGELIGINFVFRGMFEDLNTKPVTKTVCV